MGIWDANLLVDSAKKHYVCYCSKHSALDFGIAPESKWPWLCWDLLEFEQGIACI